MSEWVRCNSCCTKPGQRRFYLTNCGHLFCEECIKENPENCKVCKNPCKSIMLTSQMKPEVEEYFTDIPTLLSRQQKKILQAYEFQRSHWKHFVSLHDKQEAMLEKLQKNLPRLMELEREVIMLREENNHLKRILSEGKHLTPGKNKVPSPGISLRRGLSNTQSPTPYSNSPYGRAVTTTPQQDGLKRWQSQIPRTPAGPSRLTVRTPPSNGMIGSTPRRSPSPLSQRQGSAGSIPGLTMRMACTPGHQEPVTPSMLKAAGTQNTYSPMCVNSPISSSSTTRTGSWILSQLSSSQHTPGKSTSGGTYLTHPSSALQYSQPHNTNSDDSGTSHSSQLDPARRQIQLHNQRPRTTPLVKAPYLTTPNSASQN